MTHLPASLPDYKWSKDHHTLRALPARIGGAIAFYLAYITGLLLWLIARNRPAVLVLRTDGLGDAVVFEPALRALASRYEHHELHLWAPAATCELFRGLPYIDRHTAVLRGYKEGCLTYFASLRWRARIGWSLGRTRFDAAIYPAFSPEPFGNYLLTSARAVERLIPNGDLENQFDWQRARTQSAVVRVLPVPPTSGSASHDLHRNARLATQLGSDPTALHPRIDLDLEAKQHAETLIKQWQDAARNAGATGLLGIVPGGSMGKFRYPPERWAHLLRAAWQQHRLLPVLLAPLSDDALASIGAPADVPVVGLPRPTTVANLAANIARLDAVLSIDTGPAHIAAAMRVPTVVLSNGGHPDRFFPWPGAPWVRSLVFQMPCAGCFCRCPLAEVECLTRIPPQDVLAALDDVLRARIPAIRAA